MLRAISSSRAHTFSRPVDKNLDLSKILKIALGVFTTFASFTFLTAEIAFIVTAVVIGGASIYLLNANNVFSRSVWRRPNIFSSWRTKPTIVHPRGFFGSFSSSPAFTPVRGGWFGARRAPVGTGGVSPIAAPRSAATRPVVFRASTDRRDDGLSRGFYRAETRARVGERR